MLSPKSFSSLSSLALVACSLMATVSVSSLAQRPDQPAGAQEGESEPSPLQTSMVALRNGQRAMRGLLEDPVANRDALLEALHSMQAASLTSLGEHAFRAEDMDDAAYALFDVGFRQTLNTLLGNLLAMEEATLRGDAPALAAAYEELKATKGLGHDTYQG